jgi:peroxiredoxin
VRIAALLIAIAAILSPLPRDEVQAADTILKPWAGGQLPLFTLQSLTGEPIDLTQVQAGAVLVHFFATWCEACRLEFAALRQLHDHLAGESVMIIGVDAGETDTRVRRFFAQEPAPFSILLDRDKTVSKAWKVSVLPTTVLLDGDLAPRLVAEGDLDWAQPEIEQLITSLSQQKARGKPDRASFSPLHFRGGSQCRSIAVRC